MADSSRAVFLSYASQDAGAALRICEALRAAGVEVWFDRSELRGGDAWDAKIRRQIKECALFVPVISANTQARLEGYFRLEWKLAAQRTHTMADAKPFLVPVCIDGTRDADAHVPEEFRAVQWTPVRDDVTATKFAERVRALLHHGQEETSAGQAPGSFARFASAPSSVRRSRRWQGIAVAVTLAGLVGALALWRPWRNSATAPPISEARKLVEKARDVFESGDLTNRETYVLTEALLKKAEDLDVTDAEAWALHASVSWSMDNFGFDSSAERLAAVKAQAERALKLAPASVAARLAYANMLLTTSENTAEAEQMLNSLTAERPDDWRVLRVVSRLHRRKGNTADAIEVLRRARQLSDDHQAVTGDLVTVLVRSGHYAEAETVVAESLARKSNGRVLEYDVRLKLNWRGDAAAAAAALERWPAWMFTEDRGVQCAAQVWMWNRQPARALAVVARFPRDYIRHNRFTGPRAALTAWLHELAGNAQAAQSDWKAALQVADRELAAAPASSDALHWKAWALARLGDRAAAEAILKELIERRTSSFRANDSTVGLVGLALVAGQTDRAFSELQRLFKQAETDSWGLLATRAVLDLNPCFDGVRDDPRFKAIRAAAPAPEAVKASAISSAQPEPKSVAVLAFDNLSDDKANEYFSDGISEELINVLGRVPGLTVKGSTSAFYFKGNKQVSPAEIARQLGVGYVVRGSVRKDGNKVRIAARLTQAADDRLVWSLEPITRELKDVLTLQQEIAALIAENLQLKLGANVHPARAVNPEALRLVLEGRFFWNQRTPPALSRAEGLLKQASTLDPQFAPPHAGLADVYQIRMSNFNNAGDLTAAAREARLAREAAQQARALDPLLAEAYATLGYVTVWGGTYAESARLLQRALELNPNLANAHRYYAFTLAGQGRLDAALEECGRAMELDPLALANPLSLARNLNLAQRYADALKFAEIALRLQTNDAPHAHWGRAEALQGLGRRTEAADEARIILRQEIRGHGDAEAIWILRQAGFAAEAVAFVRELEKNLAADNYLRGFNLAAIGQSDAVFPLLARTPRGGPQSSLFYSPMFDALRDDPRFGRLLEQLGCAAEYKLGRETLARMLQEARAKR